MSKIIRPVDELYEGHHQWEVEDDEGQRAYMTFQEMIAEKIINWSAAMDEVDATLGTRVRSCPHCPGEECSH